MGGNSRINLRGMGSLTSYLKYSKNGDHLKRIDFNNLISIKLLKYGYNVITCV